MYVNDLQEWQHKLKAAHETKDEKKQQNGNDYMVGNNKE